MIRHMFACVNPSPRHSSRVQLFALLAVSSMVWLPLTSTSANDGQVYQATIKPLLKEKCIACHGPLVQEAGLRLDAIQFLRQGSDSGDILSTANEGSSELLRRVATDDAGQRMPPEGDGSPLNQEQLLLLQTWVAQGSPGPDREEYVSSLNDHWAFAPVQRPSIAATADEISAIDQLIGTAHRKSQVHPLPTVDDATWLRRVTLDLTGLPPTPQRLREFCQSSSPSKRGEAVALLLASPAYGERWGRNWMDVWRYSDWDGYKQELRGSQRHIWHWRDWIVESLNANKPYNQMLLEMLAGDEVAPGDAQVLRATGFLARNFHKSNRNIWLEATVEHVGKAFLGLTLNCAKCHDHKYDPISQQAYYQFRAIFEPHHVRTEQLAGQPDVTLAGIPRAYDANPTAETYLFIRGDDRRPDKDHALQPGVLDWLSGELQFTPEQLALPVLSYYPALAPTAKANALQVKRNKLGAAHDKAAKILQEIQGQAVAIQSEPSPQSPEKTTVDSSRTLPNIELLENHQLASAEVSEAYADLRSLLARYRAEEARYLPAAPEEDSSTSTDEIIPIEERVDSLSRIAAALEHEHQCLADSLAVLKKQIEGKSIERELAAARQASKPASELKKIADRKAANAKELADAQAALEKRQAEDISQMKHSPVGDVFPQESTGRRTALAHWIIDPRNPLTARVAVNQIWLRHFGTGLCASEYDFGMNSPPPALAPLLDWLADEFIQSGWNMKHLHRLIVLSDAYARQSHTNDEALLRHNEQIDPDNRLLWRGSVRRLDAEQVRDSLLAVGNSLDQTLGGPDIDFQNGEDVYRRSIYFRHAYEKQMQMLVLFDAASPNECYRRLPSIIPQQALALANSSLARKMAKQLSEHVWTEIQSAGSVVVEPDSQLETSEKPVAFINELFLRTLGRLPTGEELAYCADFLSTVVAEDGLSETSNSEPAESVAAAHARESLAVALLNHNDFVSVR
ncbi:MAG: DUF1553 domain-containing protein [Planctomycetales bacterium]|nr:DUF1553 domain-containing protein [Planctomycetales bacterium]